MNKKKFEALTVKENTALVDDSWIDKLWAWADENDVPDYGWENTKGLPRDKEKLLNLTELNLNTKKLTILPKEIGNLRNLTELYLLIDYQLTEFPKIDKLTEFSKELGNLTNLTKLYLAIDKLTELPKELGNLTNLTKLNLYPDLQTMISKKLTILPKDICNLIKLTTLSLRKINLKELPKEIVNLDSLTNLELTDNPNLILTKEQKKWILNLKKNGCDISYDDDLLNRNLPIIKKNIIDDALKYKRNTNINLEDISVICQSKFEDIDLFRENLYEILRHMGYVEDYSTTPTEEGKKRFLVSKKHAYGYMSLIRKEFAGELLVEVEKFVNGNKELNEKLNYPFQLWKRIDLDGLIV